MKIRNKSKNRYIFYLNWFRRVRSAYEVKQKGKLFEVVKIRGKGKYVLLILSNGINYYRKKKYFLSNIFCKHFR